MIDWNCIRKTCWLCIMKNGNCILYYETIMDWYKWALSILTRHYYTLHNNLANVQRLQVSKILMVDILSNLWPSFCCSFYQPNFFITSLVSWSSLRWFTYLKLFCSSILKLIVYKYVSPKKCDFQTSIVIL
jgi:hypothetical protein